MSKLQQFEPEEIIFYKKSFNLPSHWLVEGAHFAFDEVRDGTHDSPKPVSQGFKLITSKNLKHFGIDFTETVFISEEDYKEIKKRSEVKTGDVLFSMIGTVGNVAIVNEFSDFAIKNVGLFRSNPKLLFPKFSIYWLKSSFYQDYLDKLKRGGTQKFVSLGVLRSSPIPLPPLAEQQQIAAKLDELLAQVDSLKTRLDAIPKILKRFRQSVLASAVSGKLTEEWRESNEVPSIKILLKQIQKERADLKLQKKLKSSFGNSENPIPLFENIPVTWEWVTFEHIAKNDNNALKAGPFGSALKKSDCVEVGYKVYGQEQVISGDESLVTYFVNQLKFDELKSCEVKQGDILVSLVGTIGKILVLSEKAEKGIINPRLVKLSIDPAISKKFVALYLRSPTTLDFFKGFSHGGTMEILNLGILKQLPIALPPSEEQVEIVGRVEQLLTYADQIEQRVKDAQSRVNHLTQSILAKAFRGELTAEWREQNPELISGENSAEALLARIQAEREASGKVVGTRRKKIAN